MANELSVTVLSRAVSAFFPKAQLMTVIDTISDVDNEDWQSNLAYFIGILKKLKDTFENMPKTYETQQRVPQDEGCGQSEGDCGAGQAIARLHYFVGGCDWWIIEKDMQEEQLQAFGVARLNGNELELGYISIAELIELFVVSPYGPLFVELDFHWQPTRLKDIPELAGMFDQPEKYLPDL